MTKLGLKSGALAAPFLLAGPVFADDLNASTAIDAVLVFPSNADVTRRGEVRIPAGEHRVIVSGLPRYVDPNSLRAAFGSDAVIVGAVEAAEAYAEDGGPDEARRLEAALQDLRDEVQIQNDRISAAQLQLQYLNGRAAASEPGEGGPVNPENWRTALNVLEDGALDARASILEATRARRALEEEIARLELELRSWDDDLSLRTNVEIALTATRAVTTAFELNYQVPQAGWSALYEARLDSAAEAMALDQKIQVFQNTGEDWEDVALSVSTAPPSWQMSAPEVYTQYLTIQPPPPPAPPPAAAAPRAAGGAFFDRAETEEARDMDAFAVTGSLSQPIDRVSANFASTYSVGGRVDVPSDNTPRTFTVGQEEVAVELALRAAPRISLEAFVTAKVTYEGDGPLPGGTLRKYRDGAFLREDYLPALIPGEELELGFGIDQAVVVSWVNDSEGTSEAGLMGRVTEIGEDHRFTMLNRHDQPFTLELIDFQPIPQDDDIVVRVDPNATPPSEETFEDRPGVLLWRAEVAPGESLEVRNAFTIQHPRSENLVRRR